MTDAGKEEMIIASVKVVGREYLKDYIVGDGYSQARFFRLTSNEIEDLTDLI
jgi:hypothetical protein